MNRFLFNSTSTRKALAVPLLALVAVAMPFAGHASMHERSGLALQPLQRAAFTIHRSILEVPRCQRGK